MGLKHSAVGQTHPMVLDAGLCGDGLFLRDFESVMFRMLQVFLTMVKTVYSNETGIALSFLGDGHLPAGMSRSINAVSSVARMVETPAVKPPGPPHKMIKSQCAFPDMACFPPSQIRLYPIA